MANPRPIGQEPTLDEMLSEPIIRLVMASDGVTHANMKTLVETMQNGRVARQDSCATRRPASAGTQMAISHAPHAVDHQTDAIGHETGATGPQVFDGATNIWLEEIMAELDCDRQLAWRLLGAVLQCLRTRLPIDLAAHLGSQLPVLIRGSYYAQGAPRPMPSEWPSRDEFLEAVSHSLPNTSETDVQQAVQAVFQTVSRHVTEGHLRKMRLCVSRDLAAMWSHGAGGSAKGTSGNSISSDVATSAVGQSAPRSRRQFRKVQREVSTKVASVHAGAFSRR